MKEITIPQLGVNDEKVTLIEWLVNDKEKVKTNQEICVVETTKSTVSVDSPYDGYLKKIVKEGEEIDFQQIIAVVLDSPDDKYSVKSIKKKTTNKKITSVSSIAGYTQKAYDCAIKHGINIDMIQKERGIIREIDVIKYLEDDNLQEKGIDGGKIDSQLKPGQVSGMSVAIYGTGLGGKMVYEYITSLKQYNIICFINDYISDQDKKELYGLPIIHGSNIEKEKHNIDAIVCFIADNTFRLTTIKLCERLNIWPLSVISTDATIRSSTKLGKAILIKDGAVISSFCTIGDGVIVDDNVTIAHHVDIGEGCFIAPGATIGGGVTIGSKSIVSVGASIVSKINIGKNVIISAGSTVHRDVPDDSVVEGNPAKIIGTRKH